MLLAPSEVPIDYFAEYLESDRFEEPGASQALRDYIQQKYRGRQIDLVIAVTDVALQFVLQYRNDLFPSAPIVFAGFFAPAASIRTLGPGLTGAVMAKGFEETLALALRLHPSTTQVFVVARWPELRFDSLQTDLRAFESRVRINYLSQASLSDVLTAVRAAPRSSVILFIRYADDSIGSLQTNEAAHLVADAATVPVYGVADSYIGSGVIGGAVLSPGTVGKRIGEITRLILHGTRPQDIPIEEAAVVPTFDWRQLRRWGIAEGALPAGSIIRFRELSPWERYRTAIVVTASVLLLQSALIASLVFERRRRRRAEIDSRRNLAAMAHLERRADMGELATSLAHELNQPLNAILQNAGVAQRLLTANTVPPALGEMADILSDIRKFDDARSREQAERVGCVAYLRKPCEAETILAMPPHSRRAFVELLDWLGERRTPQRQSVPPERTAAWCPIQCRSSTGMPTVRRFRGRDRECVHVSRAALPRWWRCRSSSSASSRRRHALPHRHQPQAHQ